MIVQLKMRTTGKIFDKVCLKAIHNKKSPFYNMWSVIKDGTDIQQIGEMQNFEKEVPFLKLFLSGKSWSLHKKNPEEYAWSAYCNDFEKSEWEFFLSKEQI